MLSDYNVDDGALPVTDGEEVWPKRGSCWKRSWHGSLSCLKLAVNLQEEGPGWVWLIVVILLFVAIDCY